MDSGKRRLIDLRGEVLYRGQGVDLSAVADGWQVNESIFSFSLNPLPTALRLLP